jgi:hypothetical protein
MPMEAVSVAPEPESAAVRYERERIDAWIRNRLLRHKGDHRPVEASPDLKLLGCSDDGAT